MKADDSSSDGDADGDADGDGGNVVVRRKQATRTGVGIAATVREDKTKERKELMAEQSPTLTRHSDALRVFRPTPTLYLLILQPQPTLQQQPSFTSP
ncbi:hypothetical protein M0804_003914 [Polistes exclamans]|nr:hypothetical protein M0804_003914 [Polistes exclamans]